MLKINVYIIYTLQHIVQQLHKGITVNNRLFEKSVTLTFPIATYKPHNSLLTLKSSKFDQKIKFVNEAEW